MGASSGCRMLAMVVLVGVAACASGCVYKYPTLHYVPAAKLDTPPNSVRAFQCEAQLMDVDLFGIGVRHPIASDSKPIPMKDRDTTERSLGLAWEEGAGFLSVGMAVETTKFVLLHRPGYCTQVVEEWDFSFDPEWSPVQSVEEEEKALDEVFCACDDFPWMAGSSFHAVPWSLAAPSEPHRVIGSDSWNAQASTRNRDVSKGYQEWIRFAAGEYERLLNLARRLPTDQVLMPYDPDVKVVNVDGGQHEVSKRDNRPLARHQRAIQRLQWKIGWLREQSNVASGGVANAPMPSTGLR